jgi:predicted enzyme related to lactoylglutathione lyase
MLNCTAALITIAAVDFDQLIAFYATLLNQPPQPFRPGVYAGFRVAGIEIGIFQPKASNTTEFTGGGAVSLCLEVDDLAAALDDLASAGYAQTTAVITASHGQESYIYDPDGNRIILHQSKKVPEQSSTVADL